jgi:acylphosphatase
MDDSCKRARAHVKIQGRVQGVYFRASTVRQAQDLGLTGWVRNCADGSVEAVAEGSRDQIELLIAWCNRGPPGAQVSKVTVQWDTAQNVLRGFSVKR